MQIYHYDSVTLDFITSGTASESPLESGVWLLPAHSTGVAPPQFDPLTHSCKFVSGVWILDVLPEPKPEPEPIQPTYEEIEAMRIASLWQAAHDYEYAQISGSAIGLLARGVMQSKPKCIAVQNWIKDIWTEYYTRKANGSTNIDYSMCGACPYTVPELMAELVL